MNHDRLLRRGDRSRATADGERPEPRHPTEPAVEPLSFIRRAERGQVEPGHFADQSLQYGGRIAPPLVRWVSRDRFDVGSAQRSARSGRQPTRDPGRVAHYDAIHRSEDVDRITERFEGLAEVFAVGAVAQGEDLVTSPCAELGSR